MRGKKLLLAKVLHNSGLLKHITDKNGLHVFCYHRIARDSETIDRCAFDNYVYSGYTRDVFISNLEWLKKSTNILNLDRLLSLCNGKDVGKGPYGIVTFDDAYIDCYAEAYPILKKMNIPALVFVPSKLIDEGKMGWWDLIAYILKNTKLDAVNWKNETFSPKKQYDYTFRYFLNEMKSKPFQDNTNLVDDLASICQVDIPSPEEQAASMMNWDQIKEISKDVFDIGSHTHTHRVLTTLSAQEQYEELFLSKKMIEEKTGKQVKSLAYPVGGSKCYDAVTQQLAKDCGYQVIFSFNTGFNNVNNLNPFDICRFEPAHEQALLAGQCALPKILL